MPPGARRRRGRRPGLGAAPAPRAAAAALDGSRRHLPRRRPPRARCRCPLRRRPRGPSRADLHRRPPGRAARAAGGLRRRCARRPGRRGPAGRGQARGRQRTVAQRACQGGGALRDRRHRPGPGHRRPQARRRRTDQPHRQGRRRRRRRVARHPHDPGQAAAHGRGALSDVRRALVRSRPLPPDRPRQALADGGLTTDDNLWRLCPHHHALKTHGGWKVVGTTHNWDLVPTRPSRPTVAATTACRSPTRSLTRS